MQEENKIKKSFHQNMKAELKKVIWPTGNQVVKSTFATIGFVLAIAITLMVLNLFFDFLNKKWFDIVTSDNTSSNTQVESINNNTSDASSDTSENDDENLSGIDESSEAQTDTANNSSNILENVNDLEDTVVE